jgi:hypothetical protein
MNVPCRITLGVGSKAQLRNELARASVKLNPLAERLFVDERFQTAQEEVTVEITAVSVASLGHKRGATFGSVTASAGKVGLLLCPLELGPRLRLRYTNQPESEASVGASKGEAPSGAITVASAAPPDDEDRPWGFYLLQAGGETWLRGYRSWSGHVWASKDMFLFLRNHSAA